MIEEHENDVLGESLPDDSLMRIAEIEKDLKEIKETLEFIKATMVKADNTITGVAEQVMPTVNDLMKSPLLKMLGMKK